MHDPHDRGPLGSPERESRGASPLSRRERRQSQSAYESESESATSAPPASAAAQSPSAQSPSAPSPSAPSPGRDAARPSLFSAAGLFSTTTDSLPDAQPNILVVCTGNICRSPFAETLLTTHLGELDVRVHSAGTQALVGRGMPAEARSLALQHGVASDRAAAHRARLLTEDLMRDADLVLTMTEQQATHAVQLRPRRLHRTFTVREFDRLATSLSDDDISAAVQRAENPRMRLSALLQTVADQRGVVRRSVEPEDVIDPYKQSDAVYQQSVAEMLPGLGQVERIVRAALS